jgi:hypothetical protein
VAKKDPSVLIGSKYFSSLRLRSMRSSALFPVV